MYEAWFLAVVKRWIITNVFLIRVLVQYSLPLQNTSWLVPGVRDAESEFDTQCIELECALIASVNVMVWCISCTPCSFIKDSATLYT